MRTNFKTNTLQSIPEFKHEIHSILFFYYNIVTIINNNNSKIFVFFLYYGNFQKIFSTIRLNSCFGIL